ncbi:response regulator transcription factor [Fluviicola taffensis]|uniref:response regulator transcription factor n=1 Tax=Fluviicola taffensis TaxID=191579 RepID=UPI003137F897
MTNPEIIKVAVVDDHALVRHGIKLFLKQFEDVDVIMEAQHGQDFLDQLNTIKVDLVLLDLEMPVMDGKVVLKYLKSHYPEILVLALTMHQHDSFISHMMELGANGYLLKESPPEDVIHAIRTVSKEGIFFNKLTSRALLGRVMAEANSKGASQHFTINSLKQRELDILKLIVAEKTTEQIAEELFLSPKTIEGYRKSLYEKTGATNVVGLVKFAIKHHLV